MTSTSWALIGMFVLASVIVHQPCCPHSPLFAFAFARSRLIGESVLSYAQLVGGIGPFDAWPTPSHTPLTSASMSSAYATACRSALTLNGGFVWLTWYANAASDG